MIIPVETTDHQLSRHLCSHFDPLPQPPAKMYQDPHSISDKPKSLGSGFAVTNHGDSTMAVHMQVKLGPSFLIPNSQIGTFGAVTAFKSMVRTRSDMFDVTVAGPAAGGITALILFGLGLYLTVGGSDTTVRFLFHALGPKSGDFSLKYVAVSMWVWQSGSHCCPLLIKFVNALWPPPSILHPFFPSHLLLLGLFSRLKLWDR